MHIVELCAPIVKKNKKGWSKKGSDLFSSLIEYTGNERMGVTPALAVHFAYSQRPDKRAGYVASGKYPALVLLDTITTSANDEVARTYRLGYEQSGQTGRLRLQTLQECGSFSICSTCPGV